MTTYKGLNENEVIENRERYGSNILTPPAKIKPILLFLRSFKDPIIIVLIVAALLSVVIAIYSGEFAETIGIFCAIFLSTGIAFWFEYDANKKFELLNKINNEELYDVYRNGVITSVKKNEIVVGDIIILESGDEIPADGTLLQAQHLLVNESCMTGELSVHKGLNIEPHKECTYPSNILLRGTTILEGNCTYRVDNVGDNTEFGKVARQATEIIKEKTPLAKQLTKLAQFVSIIAFIVAILVFISLVIQEWLKGAFDNGLFTVTNIQMLLEFFMVSVAILVVAVPEGLPMSITLSLALSMRKMLKTNNLVRKMHACETMGAATVICTDKTGTLTQNKMSVTDMYQISDTETSFLDLCIGVNSTANITQNKESNSPIALGNPTECALLMWLHNKGISYEHLRLENEVIEQLPFNTERKYMATMIQINNERIVLVKGAPEVLLAKSSNIAEDYSMLLTDKLHGYQNRAMRTLGFAYRIVDSNNKNQLSNLISDLNFIAIAAIEDPIRSDVPAAINCCKEAGIDIKIVTGDTSGTAREIAKQCGIWTESDTEDNIISGTDFENLTDEAAMARIKALKVMCRARPGDKQRLVLLLKRMGEVVAVTGDGTNDAPALNYADVGLSMGSGTSVAKESSDITLLDDSFASITSAVLWGRSLYRNIQRFIMFQLTINVTAMAIVVVGPFLGIEMPLTVTQMLWVNLIIDTFASMALSSLPPNKSVLKEKPRKSDSFILIPKMKRQIALYGGVFTSLLLGIIYYMTHKDGEIQDNELCFFFTLFVFLQFWNLFNAKAFFTNNSSFHNLKNCKGFLLTLLIIAGGQFILVQFGGVAFRTVPLSVIEWIEILAISSIPLWFSEIARTFKVKH